MVLFAFFFAPPPPFFFFQVLKILSGNSFQECHVLSYALGSRASLSPLEKKKKKQPTPTLHLSSANGFIKKAQVPQKTAGAAHWETPLKSTGGF